jgi:hypothetical protein
MSEHENEPIEGDEVRELSDEELDDVAGGNAANMDQPELHQ